MNPTKPAHDKDAAEARTVEFLFNEYKPLQVDEQRTKDLIRAAYRYGLAAQKMRGQVPEWMPIETAPRDGTAVLVLCEGVSLQAEYRKNDPNCWFVTKTARRLHQSLLIGCHYPPPPSQQVTLE